MKFNELRAVAAFVKNKGRYYHRWGVRKRSGGYRVILAPHEMVKTWQKNIAEDLAKYPIHPAATGFVSGGSPLTNAKRHLGRKKILSVDVENFFYSFKPQLVKNLFTKYPVRYSPRVAYEVVTYSDYYLLPMGSPASPVITNLLLVDFDRDMEQLCKNKNAIYSRYADDITISFDLDRIDLGYWVSEINKNLKPFGLHLKNKKTRVLGQHRRMSVTGINVNQKPGVPRSDYRNLRAALHNYVRDGIKLDSLELQRLQGKIAWVKQLNPANGQKLEDQYRILLSIQ